LSGYSKELHGAMAYAQIRHLRQMALMHLVSAC